jgi:hypothetical protein
VARSVRSLIDRAVRLHSSACLRNSSAGSMGAAPSRLAHSDKPRAVLPAVPQAGQPCGRFDGKIKPPPAARRQAEHAATALLDQAGARCACSSALPRPGAGAAASGFGNRECEASRRLSFLANGSRPISGSGKRHPPAPGFAISRKPERRLGITSAGCRFFFWFPEVQC